MSTHFDHKGKIFTDVVSKERVAVIVQTTSHRVSGYLHTRPDQRLKDELDAREDFLALTDVSVSNLEGKQEYESEFMAINRAHIIWVIPEDELTENAGD
ncbi:MAG: hypothetical protein DWQ07_12545 [Chloroflexi bacterium]|nr:MAG: hypothetical protein DWQ07_12545 [Chloroflexota bacterium]MBL1196868.1 hypothetical protein [Chloroflexota bacterium]NOH14164.1 hypothetical protein [Chloroflexota bacterium]